MFAAGDNKVRDHHHVTRKEKSFVHWSCNTNLKLTKKFPVMFHIFKGYDSHLIIKEFCKFDIKIEGIPNGLENTWLLQLTKIAYY